MLKAKKDATTNAAARRKVILEIPGCASVWTCFRSVVEKNPSSPELYDPSKGMTSGGCSSGSAKYSFQDELSSRPERSVVEGSAVRPSGAPNCGVKVLTLHAPALFRIGIACDFAVAGAEAPTILAAEWHD